MARFTDVDVFLAVVDAGSFRGAVASLGVTRSTVSRAIQRLESHLGATLFLRDTHSIRLTDTGAVYFQHASDAAVSLAAAERAVAATSGVVEGTIRVSAPPAFGPGVITPLCASFLAQHPRAHIALSLTDRLVNPLLDGVDLAVRTGQRLTDSDLISTRLTQIRMVAVATPSVAALVERSERIPFVQFVTPKGTTHDYAPTPQPFAVRLQVDDYLSLLEAVLCGVGVGVVGERLAADPLAQGRLVQVFPRWSLPVARIWAVYPKATVQPLKVRAMVDHLAAGLRGP